MYKNFIVVIAAVVTLGLAAPSFAADNAQQGTSHHQWNHKGHHHHHWHHHWPFAEALHNLNLSKDQKTQIHADLEQAHKNIHTQMKALRADRHAFSTTSPGADGYTSIYKKYSQDAAHAVQSRVYEIASLHTKIYNLLTAKQQKQLAKELAASSADNDD